MANLQGYAKKFGLNNLFYMIGRNWGGHNSKSQKKFLKAITGSNAEIISSAVIDIKKNVVKTSRYTN